MDNVSLFEIREALKNIYPTAFVMDDESINAAIRGSPLEIPGSEFEVSLDAQEIIQIITQYSPIIAATISAAKTAYDIYASKTKNQAVDEIYELIKSKNPIYIDELSEKTAKEVIASSLTSAIKLISKDTK